MPVKPTFQEALKFWFKLGFISFGGPAGQVAIMHDFVVEKKKWLSESKFLHALNYCMLLPGPEAQQLATYIGWLLHGVRGGIVAGALFVLPSVVILLALSILYVLYGTLPVVAALFIGLKPAVVAVVLLAFIKIAKKALITYFHYGLAAVSFICIFFFNISFLLIILSALILGFILKKIKPDFLEQKSNKKEKIVNESEYYINKNSAVAGVGFSYQKIFLQLLLGLCLWVLPFLLLLSFYQDRSFWSTLVFFFTESALVTFGGAYAVLPFVAQYSVEKFHWLSKLQMMDGLALGETTPGPLIMVLAFVGFMAGYNRYDFSVSAATVGLLVTVYYTFLPGFLFIFIGAPVIERTHQNTMLKSVLSVITAAVVGVVLNLAVYFAVAVIFPKGVNTTTINYPALLWIIVSVAAMTRFKVGMIPMILISALGGVIYFLISSYL